MKRLFEFKCMNALCTEYNKPSEHLLKLGESPQCSKCSNMMIKQITTTHFQIHGEGAHKPGMSYK